MSVAQETKECQGCGGVFPVEAFSVKGLNKDGTTRYSGFCSSKFNNCYNDPTKRTRQRENQIVPVRSGIVPFYGGKEVRCVEGEGDAWVYVGDVCQRIDIREHGQIERLKGDPSFNSYLKKEPSGSWVLHRSKLAGWVRLINAAKVSEEARPGLLWLQNELDKVMYAWVTGGEMPASPAIFASSASRVIDIGTPLKQATDQLVAWLFAVQFAADAARQEAELARAAAERAEQEAVRARKNTENVTRVEVEVVRSVSRTERGHVYADRYNCVLLRTAFEQGEAGEWGNIPNLPELLANGWVPFNIGESGRKAGMRQKEHAGKNRIGKGETLKRIYTDNPHGLERLIHARRVSGVLQVPGTKDLFLIPPWHITKILDWPDYMTLEDAQVWFSGWVYDGPTEEQAA